MYFSGFLDIKRLKREMEVLKAISAAPITELLDAGLYPVDIYAIRLSVEDDSAARDVQFLQHFNAYNVVRFPLLGLLGFGDDFYQQAKEYIQILIPEMKTDYKLIKFLVFFALFCPSHGRCDICQLACV